MNLCWCLKEAFSPWKQRWGQTWLLRSGTRISALLPCEKLFISDSSFIYTRWGKQALYLGEASCCCCQTNRMNQQSPRLREAVSPDSTPTHVQPFPLLCLSVCLSRDQATPQYGIALQLPFLSSLPDENVWLGACCDWKPSTRSSLWGSDPAPCWAPWLESKAALQLFARLRAFRTLQEKNPCLHEKPSQQKGEKDPQETSTDPPLFWTGLQCCCRDCSGGLQRPMAGSPMPQLSPESMLLWKEAPRTAA